MKHENRRGPRGSHGHDERGGREHYAHHPDHDGLPEGGRPPHFGFGGFGGQGGGGPEGRGGRARRGEARFLLLDVLRDGQKHGYEIIKTLEERSGGQYAPSPGTVYPTLQFLEDAGLIRSEQQSERKVYELTETGKAELETRAEEIRAFWSRQAAPVGSEVSRTEARFVREEFESLAQTTRRGMHDLLTRNEDNAIRLIRQAIEQCRSEVRRILVEAQNESPQAETNG